MTRRFLSWLLVLLMLGSLALPVCAEETDDPAPSVTETQKTEDETPDNTTEADTSKDETTATTPETKPACEAHKYAFAKVLKESTCTEEGSAEYACTVCGAVTTKAVEKKAHSYDNGCDTNCNVCAAEREPNHNFSLGWSRNSRKHWHACIVCGVEDELSDHFPGPAATEEKDQFCLTCGLLMTPRLTHTHSFKETISYDETGHWYSCSGCQEQKDFSAHEYDSLCDDDCNKCGYTIDVTHAYDTQWSSDETGHYYACTICGDKQTVEAHVPGSEATEERGQLCSVCAYEIAPALEHTHIPEEGWEMDEASHWHGCACGERVEEAAHDWDAGTENEDTTVTFRCKTCAAEKTEGEPYVEPEIPTWVLPTIGALLLAVAVLLIILLVKLLKKPKKKRK